MKAAVYDHYGPPDVLRIAEVPKPTPKEGEVLVRVRAVAVTRADCATREANRHSGRAVSALSRVISGIRAPRQPILGSDFAGTVEQVGAGVAEFARGDHVFGNTGFRFGAHAEFLSINETSRIVHKPPSLTFVEAAAITDGGLYALLPLRLAKLTAGQSILVYGASGAIGTAGVQLARWFGAEVTAVCDAKNVDLMRTIGAEHVIDYTQDDFTKNGQTYDVIFDAVGKQSFSHCEGSMKPGGRYLATDGLQNLVLAIWTKRFGDKKVIFDIPPRVTKQDMLFLKDLVEAGRFRPVVDRTYPLDQIRDAARYVETEQKTGNVILTID